MFTARTVLSILIGILIGGMLGWNLTTIIAPTNTNDLIAEYYQTLSAVHVSPLELREKVAEGKNEYTIVDLRSAEEYETESIVGAINIPAYSEQSHSEYDEVDRIVAAFKALPQDKPIVVYCHSMPCMTGYNIGTMLASHGIYVRHLATGWGNW
ncbi:MAG: rhodanese-like domain-containing protein [Candidatus Peribacteraceae bacterium]